MDSKPFIEDLLQDIEQRLREASVTALETEKGDDENPILFYHATAQRDAYAVVIEVIKRKTESQKKQTLCELYDLVAGYKFFFYKMDDEIWLKTDKEFNYLIDPDNVSDLNMDLAWGEYNCLGVLCVNILSGDHRVFTYASENTLVQRATTLDIVRICEKYQKDVDKLAG